MAVKILTGDCRGILKTLPDNSVHCVVTSPPYWGMRDYGIYGQLGLEQNLGDYIDAMVCIFSEVRRVLRKDGTLWMNLGDSYAAKENGRAAADVVNDDRTFRDKPFSTIGAIRPGNANKNGGVSNRDGLAGFDTGTLKPKDICGIPWRVAFALQVSGWWLRQDIIWSKPNPMPESIKDRCTKAHEYVFLLTKSARYFFDADAIAEQALTAGNLHSFSSPKTTGRALAAGAKPSGNERPNMPPVLIGETRNKRSVWEISTAAFYEAHFATFPPALVEPCILAGCPKGGVVLDPFGGAGTTGLVADRLQRDAILIELNPEYARMAERRLKDDSGMFGNIESSQWDSMWEKPFDRPELL